MGARSDARDQLAWSERAPQPVPTRLPFMQRSSTLLLCLTLLLPGAVVLRAQDGMPDLPEDRGPARPGDAAGPERELTPEQRRLTEEVGTWDATFRSYPAPGMPPVVSSGVEVVRQLGERWLIKDLRGQLGGQPYEAHGQVGFDERTGRAIGTLVVTGESGLRVLEGNYDLGRRERVMEFETQGSDGQPRRFREVSRVLDAEHKSLEVLELLPGGQETVLLQAELVLRVRDVDEDVDAQD